jgi:Flp pilus assembly protein TadG
MQTRCVRTPRRAAAAVELLFTMPVFFVLLVGIWEVGRLVELQQVVNNAAREGARQASSGKYTAAQVQQAVLAYLTNSGLPITDSNNNVNITVTAVDVTAGSIPLNPATYNGNVIPQDHHVRVTVAYPMDNSRYYTAGAFWTRDYGVLGVGTFVPAGTLLNAESDWFVMSDVPINVPTTIPNAPLP